MTLDLGTQWVRVHRRIGLLGMLGIVMMAVAAWSAWQTPRWKRETAQLKTRLEVERVRLDELNRNVVARPDTSQQISDFVAWFPPADQSAADLNEIFAQADALGIRLLKGEYQLHREPPGDFVKYEVILPVKDNYTSVRRFVAAVLKKLPHAAITELRIERTNAESELVEARVHFSLIYRGA
jgi:hypothetical protein